MEVICSLLHDPEFCLLVGFLFGFIMGVIAHHIDLKITNRLK